MSEDFEPESHSTREPADSPRTGDEAVDSVLAELDGLDAASGGAELLQRLSAAHDKLVARLRATEG